VALTEQRKPLQQLPQALPPGQQQFAALPKTGFVFRNDGFRMVADVFTGRAFTAIAY